MSFEAQLDELIAAVKRCAVAIENINPTSTDRMPTKSEAPPAQNQTQAATGIVGSAAQTAVADVPGGVEKPTKPRGRPRSAPGAITPSTAPAATTPGATGNSVSVPLPTATAAPTYEQVRAGILTLAEKKGHAATVALLGKFGATHGKELKTEQFSEVIAACSNALLV